MSSKVKLYYKRKKGVFLDSLGKGGGRWGNNAFQENKVPYITKLSSMAVWPLWFGMGPGT